MSVHGCANSTIAAPGMLRRCKPAATMVTHVTKSGVRRLASRLLPSKPDPYSLTANPAGTRLNPRLRMPLAYCFDVPRFVVDVMLKPEIHDPQGEAIASACRRLGFGQVAGVRQGKRFEIELAEPVTQERMADLAAELLANPVIEEFSVHPA